MEDASIFIGKILYLRSCAGGPSYRGPGPGRVRPWFPAHPAGPWKARAITRGQLGISVSYR